jgi:hypothetical protein
MTKWFGQIALAAAILAVTSVTAEAGGRRGGPVVSPFGELYNTSSPEWKASGGNPVVYQQIMEQKAALLQQRRMLKQQQAMEKQAKSAAGKRGGKAGVNSALPGAAGLDSGAGGLPALNGTSKKKRRTYVGTGNSVKSEAGATQVTPSAVTPGDTIPDPLKSPSTTPASKQPTTGTPKTPNQP